MRCPAVPPPQLLLHPLRLIPPPSGSSVGRWTPGRKPSGDGDNTSTRWEPVPPGSVQKSQETARTQSWKERIKKLYIYRQNLTVSPPFSTIVVDSNQRSLMITTSAMLWNIKGLGDDWILEDPVALHSCRWVKAKYRQLWMTTSSRKSNIVINCVTINNYIFNSFNFIKEN